MHFPEGSRGQQKPPATVNPVEVKQCITKYHYIGILSEKQMFYPKRKLVDGPTYRYLFVYIYIDNDKNQLA